MKCKKILTYNSNNTMDTFYLFKSNKPAKKYMVIYKSPFTNKKRTIHFGASGYDDYTLTNNYIKKRAYIARHSVNENIYDYYKPAFWAMNILWNRKTIEESIKDIKERYPNINIIKMF